jgi:hypothetical protein
MNMELKNKSNVVICCVNRSGVFSKGRFFESIIKHHGVGVEELYSDAKTNKDLAYGDCHLVVSGKMPDTLVALIVCADQYGSLQSKSLEKALHKLSPYCEEKHLGIHMRHLQKWYSTEKIVSSALSKNDVFVYYYSNKKKPQSVSSSSNKQQLLVPSLDALLPNFLAGIKLRFADLADQDEEAQLQRHAIAYGATVVLEADLSPDVIVISDAAGAKKTWLKKCLKNLALEKQ